MKQGEFSKAKTYCGCPPSVALGVKQGEMEELQRSLIEARDRWMHRIWAEHRKAAFEEGSAVREEEREQLIQEWAELHDQTDGLVDSHGQRMHSAEYVREAGWQAPALRSWITYWTSRLLQWRRHTQPGQRRLEQFGFRKHPRDGAAAAVRPARKRRRRETADAGAAAQMTTAGNDSPGTDGATAEQQTTTQEPRANAAATAKRARQRRGRESPSKQPRITAHFNAAARTTAKRTTHHAPTTEDVTTRAEAEAGEGQHEGPARKTARRVNDGGPTDHREKDPG